MTSPQDQRDLSLESRLKQLLDQAAVELDAAKLLALTSEISRLVEQDKSRNKKDESAA